MSHTAVVFAYHNVGVRALATLLACDVQVELVVTHEDDANETIWFDSVAELARRHEIAVITPADPNQPEVIAQVAAIVPDFLFSFYYRHMLGAPLLDIPARGAFNLHGSLLPKYRGRVPVNWAIIHGETETGVSLHRMEIKPDAGALLDQQAVAILPNDTAVDVFAKLTCASEQVLLRTVPRLKNGTQQETPLDLAAGSYFGGRRPEQGRIDWQAPAQQIHNLIRALAPPYPPAFFDIGTRRVYLLGSFFQAAKAVSAYPRLYWSNGRCYADCADGYRLMITALQMNQQALDEKFFTANFGTELRLNA